VLGRWAGGAREGAEQRGGEDVICATRRTQEGNDGIESGQGRALEQGVMAGTGLQNGGFFGRAGAGN